MLRNQWTACAGSAGRLRPESLDDITGMRSWLEVHEAPLLLEMEGADGCRAQGLPTRMYAAQKTGCASEYATPLPLRRIFDLIASFPARSAAALESRASDDDIRADVLELESGGECDGCDIAWRSKASMRSRNSVDGACVAPALRRVQNSDMKLPTGTDHGNKLYAAHIRCNREKGTVAPRTARRWYGRTRAPHLGLRANGESTKTGSLAAASVCSSAYCGRVPTMILFGLLGVALWLRR